MKIFIIALSFFALFVFPADAQTSKLDGVKKIFIGDLGEGENSDLIKEKIRLLLGKQDRFEVVEAPEDADAALLGAAGVTSARTGNATTYAGNGIFRLVDINSKKTLWTFEYKRGWARPGASASDRVASKTVKQLLKDAGIKTKK